MKEETVKRLLIIAGLGLAVEGIIFLCLAIFTAEKNNTYLCLALGCIILSNLFNIIRHQHEKRRH